jgi:aminoglycoside phosphotransferase
VSDQKPADPQPPIVLREIAGALPTRFVWRNELGGLTYRIEDGPHGRFLKWTPTASGVDLSAESARLRWAGGYLTVPRVLGEGADEHGSWLLTAGLPGQMAVVDAWKQRPDVAVAAIGAGLRHLHDTLPVDDCPFDWSAPARVADARERAAAGISTMDDLHEDLRHIGTIVAGIDRLADIPPVDRAVVCHGDACAPNTLIGADGSCVGHVDLGALGVADRWADLAVATWSARNYGPGWERPLLDAYGVDADPERTAYYRLLWDLTG